MHEKFTNWIRRAQFWSGQERLKTAGGRKSRVNAKRNPPSVRLELEPLEDRRLMDAAIGAVVPSWETLDIGKMAYSFSESPDRTTLAISNLGGEVQLWNSTTGTVDKTFTGAFRFAWSAAFSPDKSKVAAAGQNGRLAVWNQSDGSLFREYDLHGSPNYTAFLTDSQLVLQVDGPPAGLEIMDLTTGTRETVVPGVWWVSASADGKLVGFNYSVGVGVYSTEKNSIIQSLPGVHGTITFSNDGKIMVLGGNGKDGFYAVDSGLLLAEVTGHAGQVLAGDFLDGDSAVVTGDGVGTALLVDCRDILVGKAPTVVKKWSYGQSIQSIAVSPGNSKALILVSTSSSYVKAEAIPEEFHTITNPATTDRANTVIPDAPPAIAESAASRPEEAPPVQQSPVEPTVSFTFTTGAPQATTQDFLQGSELTPLTIDSSPVDSTRPPIEHRFVFNIDQTPRASEFTAVALIASPDDFSIFESPYGGGRIEHAGGTARMEYRLKMQPNPVAGDFVVRLRAPDNHIFGEVWNQWHLVDNHWQADILTKQVEFERQNESLLAIEPTLRVEVNGRQLWAQVQSRFDESFLTIVRSRDGAPLGGRASQELLKHKGGTLDTIFELAVPASTPAGELLKLRLLDQVYGRILVEVDLQYDGQKIHVLSHTLPITVQLPQAPRSVVLISDQIGSIQAKDFYLKSLFYIPGSELEPRLTNARLLISPENLRAEVDRRWRANNTYERRWHERQLLREQSATRSKYSRVLDAFEETVGDLLVESVTFWHAILQGEEERPLHDRLLEHVSRAAYGPIADLGIATPRFEEILDEGKRLYREERGGLLKRQLDDAAWQERAAYLSGLLGDQAGPPARGANTGGEGTTSVRTIDEVFASLAGPAASKSTGGFLAAHRLARQIERESSRIQISANLRRLGGIMDATPAPSAAVVSATTLVAPMGESRTELLARRDDLQKLRSEIVYSANTIMDGLEYQLAELEKSKTMFDTANGIAEITEAVRDIAKISEHLIEFTDLSRDVFNRSGAALESANKAWNEKVIEITIDGAAASVEPWAAVTAKDTYSSAVLKAIGNMLLNLESPAYWIDIGARLVYGKSVNEVVQDIRDQIRLTKEHIASQTQFRLESLDRSIAVVHGELPQLE